ncbi:uncharacterized protein LOC110693824 [Chenopodium quinoa]|uniref:uncharacterized protein LOC110693824 n=1 Tax=Chenopodium quinoa TaxID=63459 RepID=UPI000B77A985|nr:uncharacterized protein LOC110693824 [Chenopodium quinoa]XP_021726669.1 uncharacterized protein LOC110693824 [Chenopodium quinoa]
MFANLCWSSWTSWNNVIHEQSTHDSIMLATGFTRDYREYNTKVHGLVSAPAVCSSAGWIPPTHSCLKVNVDAFVPGSAGVCFGVVIRDEFVKLLLIVAKKTNCRWSPKLAEAAAARYGIELARR